MPSTAQLELATFFVIGLLGGAHCLEMGGPLVAMYTGQLDGSARPSTGATTYELVLSTVLSHQSRRGIRQETVQRAVYVTAVRQVGTADSVNHLREGL
jgi:sulfite exporter TauE/SafE